MLRLSIVIPTHNRADILKLCLHHLEKQTIADEIEVIVINDVQNDKQFTQLANSTWQIPIHFETIKPCQQAVARNVGVQKARSSTVLFIGDDIFLRPDACELHVHAHEHHRSPTCVIGKTIWDPSINITEVMQWLTQSGWQFGYDKIKPYKQKMIPKNKQHLFCYTSHISLDTETAKRIPFREDVTLYGWEDIEWGMRLRDSGVPLYYEPNAVALHHHVIELKDSLQRMETLGRSAVLMKQAVPTFDRVPTGLKLLSYKIFALLPTMAGKHRGAFVRGLESE